jgi:hypothetical protein
MHHLPVCWEQSGYNRLQEQPTTHHSNGAAFNIRGLGKKLLECFLSYLKIFTTV